MANTQENSLLDWSDFNEVEQKAIAIGFSNFENGTNQPTFPFIAAVLEELGENLASIALTRPNSAKKCISELETFERVLIGLFPEELNDHPDLTEKHVKKFLLYSNVMCFLIEQLQQLRLQMAFSLELLENQAQGGSNGKH